MDYVKLTLSLTLCRNRPYVKYSLCKHVKLFWRIKLILLKALVCETSPAQTRLSGEVVFTRLSIASPFTAASLSFDFFFISLSVITCFLFSKESMSWLGLVKWFAYFPHIYTDDLRNMHCCNILFFKTPTNN